MINILLLQNLILQLLFWMQEQCKQFGEKNTDSDNTTSSLDSKITDNKTKCKSIENELKQLKTLDPSYFIVKYYFDEDGAQNNLVFQSIHRYFKITNTKYTSLWKSKGLPHEAITLYVTSDNSLPPLIDHYSTKVRAKFNGSCLKTVK